MESSNKGVKPILSSRIPIIIDLPKSADKVNILLAADMHTGSAEFSDEKWNAFEKELSKENTHVIFAGDQCEYATRTSVSDVYTQRLSPSLQKRWWVEHLEPFTSKIICIVDGNHEYNRASKDADDFPLYDIALALGIKDKYRSEGCFVDIGVGEKNGGTKQYRYVGRVQHKAYNSGSYGTADGFEGIDFFVSGHTHKPMDKPLGKMIYDVHNKTVREKTIENVVCGHFLRFGGYGERGGYRPASQKMYSLVLNGTSKEIKTIGFHL